MFEENINFDTKNLRACVLSVRVGNETEALHKQSVEEICQLARTLGINIENIFTQYRLKPDPKFFAGRGKVEELIEYINDREIELILFDNEITGIQERNLEHATNKKIYDRTSIILEIFRKRARTNQAKLQVELASIEYMLPRLKNLWTHFSRSEGIIGIRGGEGEKQLELDRRIIKERMSSIKKKLEKTEVQAQTRRKKRSNNQFIVSLVGYTNAGKTSLMNLMSKNNLIAEDLLFSTIDSTIRKVYINEQCTFLLNDTVGFINKLPHSLVASFKSTLDEINNSSLVLHVIDSSSEYANEHIQAVEEVLEEINATAIPRIRVFNKIDLLDEVSFSVINSKKDDLFISTYSEEGIRELKDRIFKEFLKYNYTSKII